MVKCVVRPLTLQTSRSSPSGPISERLREALLKVGKVTFHGQFVPPVGPYLLMADVLPILTDAASPLRRDSHEDRGCRFAGLCRS